MTVDLVLTVGKDARVAPGSRSRGGVPSDDETVRMVREAVASLPVERARSSSYVYADILTRPIRHEMVLDDLHLGDVLVALRQAGYQVGRRTGEFSREG